MNLRVLIPLTVLIILSPIPLLLPSYYLHIIIVALLYLLLSAGYCLVLGYVGLFSLSQPLFFGIGAYSTAILASRYNLTFGLTMLVSVVLAIVCAYFVGSVALRLRRFTFGLATLASTVVFYWICNNWVSLTEGPYGIKGIPLPDLPIFMEALTRLQSFYILIFILSSLGTILIYQLVRSRVGRTLKAIREDEVLAESLGINVKKYKILSFIVAAILASVAGGFQTYYLGIVTPEVINFNVTTNLLVITIVGGLDNLGGVVLSNFVFTLLPEFLRVTEFFRNILFGLILVIASTYSIDKLLKILGIHARR